MYLVSVDPKTSLVVDDGLHDGIYLIPEFRDVLTDESLGLPAFSAVALTVDWLTPIRNYKLSDRPAKAMYTITGDRRAFVWDQDKIQACLKRYMDLQFNPALMEKNKLDEMILSLLDDIDNTKDPSEVTLKFKQLNQLKDLKRAWEKENEDTNVYSDAPVVNGYKLSRLEEKALDPRSFYHKKREDL